ncbi:hypothetical protein [Kitasatospora sp. NPDC004272]
MTPIQAAVEFLVAAVTDPSGPQADHLVHAGRNVGIAVTSVANAIGAVRKLRIRPAVEQPPTRCCCGPCPLHPDGTQ